MSTSNRFSHEIRLQAVRLVCQEVGAVEAARSEAEKVWRAKVDKAVEAANTKAAKKAILKDAKADAAKMVATSRDSLKLSVESVAHKFGCKPATLRKWVDLYSESYDDKEIVLADAQRSGLSDDLKGLNLNEEIFKNAHQWIYATSLRRGFEHVLSRAAKEIWRTKTTSELAKESDQIAKAASNLSKRFGELGKSGSLIYKLSATYNELFSEQGDVRAVDWRTFAERVSSEVMVLERVASETCKRLKLKTRRTGAPPKTDRNVLLVEWVDLLSRHTEVSREILYKCALDAWKRYFGAEEKSGEKSEDEISSVEQLKKALVVGRAAKEKKVQAK